MEQKGKRTGSEVESKVSDIAGSKTTDKRSFDEQKMRERPKILIMVTV